VPNGARLERNGCIFSGGGGKKSNSYQHLGGRAIAGPKEERLIKKQWRLLMVPSGGLGVVLAPGALTGWTRPDPPFHGYGHDRDKKITATTNIGATTKENITAGA
jgi:hypothetical protein